MAAARQPDPAGLRSPALVRFFGRVMARTMARNFHGVRVAKPGPPALPAGVPVLVCANHPGWWDPAFLMVLATRLFPDRRGFGPIDARAIGKYRFMRRIGLFPVVSDSTAGAVTFLTVGRALMQRPDTMLWVTAEGRFTDPRRRPVVLRGGPAHLVTRLPRAVVLPLALEYPFWDERTPEALCHFGPALDSADHPGLSPAGWQDLMTLHLAETMDALAAGAMGRDPGRFTTLLDGRVGVGGVYDIWRRARAWSRGERFDPAHGTPANRGGGMA